MLNRQMCWTINCDFVKWGSLSNDDGDGNEKGKKATGLNWQNNNFARASRFSLQSLHDHNVKVPNLTFCRGRELKTMTSFSFPFPELWYSLIEFNSKKNCQHFKNWTSWNKRDKVWSSANSLFKWRFRSGRHRCCLRSLFNCNFFSNVKSHNP